MSQQNNDISFVIPCYNESESITDTVKDLTEVMEATGYDYEIIVINDASTDKTTARLKKIKSARLKVISNDYNLGYGASIKKGISNARFNWIGISDADGTYPVNQFLGFLSLLKDFDMIVGKRTGKIRSIPLIRRPAKWFLNKFASYLVKRKIPDVNSGMRLFKKAIALRYWNLLPDGFSLTTTLTLAVILGNYRLKYISIDYLKRKGKSKINPLRDTYNFLLLILRITMLFNPLRIFMPLFFFTFLLSLASLGRDLYYLNLTDTSVVLFIFSIIILMIGLLADLINKTLPK